MRPSILWFCLSVQIGGDVSNPESPWLVGKIVDSVAVLVGKIVDSVAVLVGKIVDRVQTKRTHTPRPKPHRSCRRQRHNRLMLNKTARLAIERELSDGYFRAEDFSISAEGNQTTTLIITYNYKVQHRLVADLNKTERVYEAKPLNLVGSVLGI